MINFDEDIEYFEKVIVSLILNKDDDYELTNDNGNKVNIVKLVHILQPSFFIVPLHSCIIESIKDFHKSYSVIPSKDNLSEYMQIHKYSFDKNEYEVSTSVQLNEYENNYVFRYLVAFIKLKVLNAQINKVSVDIKTKQTNAHNIDSIFDNVRKKFGDDIDVDITNDDEGLDLFVPESHIQMLKPKKPSGMEYIDAILGGGYEAKTLIVLFGRPKVGKSLAISNMAVNAVNAGLNVLIITVELADRKYIKRIGSNLFDIPFQDYDTFKDENCLSLEKQYQENYEKSHPNHGVLVTKEYATGSINAFDIESFARKMEKKRNIKFDVVFVDYLNLLDMSSFGGDGGTYMPIKKTAEQLRKIAQRNDWCVVTATQAKQNAFDKDRLEMEDVAESSGVVATVDTLIGLISAPGSLNFKMTCVANRDNGYMGSYADYEKVFTYYRLEPGDNNIWMSESDKLMYNLQCKMTGKTASPVFAIVDKDDKDKLNVSDPKETKVETQTTESTTPLEEKENSKVVSTFQGEQQTKQNVVQNVPQQAQAQPQIEVNQMSGSYSNRQVSTWSPNNVAQQQVQTQQAAQQVNNTNTQVTAEIKYTGNGFSNDFMDAFESANSQYLLDGSCNNDMPFDMMTDEDCAF